MVVSSSDARHEWGFLDTSTCVYGNAVRHSHSGEIPIVQTLMSFGLGVGPAAALLTA